MSRWFRLYGEAIRHPKVAKLNDSDFRLWIKLLAVASEHDGKIPPLDELRHVLKTRVDHLSRGCKRLVSIGLMEALGGCYAPHNWDKYQYKSDSSTPRVTLHRKRNVTPPDTDSETETPLAKEANGASHDSDQIFWANAKAFLKPHSSGDPGKLIGKWLREQGKELTIGAITAAQLERAVNPLEYVSGYFRRHGNGGGETAWPC